MTPLTVDTTAVVAVYNRVNHKWSNPKQLRVQFGFDSTNPFAVTLTVETTPWTFDRALLRSACDTDACRDPAAAFGEGDVKIRHVTSDRLVIMLHSPGGIAAITVDVVPCTQFIQATDTAVAPGAETYNIDAWIAGLLGETA